MTNRLYCSFRFHHKYNTSLNNPNLYLFQLIFPFYIASQPQYNSTVFFLYKKQKKTFTVNFVSCSFLFYPFSFCSSTQSTICSQLYYVYTSFKNRIESRCSRIYSFFFEEEHNSFFHFLLWEDNPCLDRHPGRETQEVCFFKQRFWIHLSFFYSAHRKPNHGLLRLFSLLLDALHGSQRSLWYTKLSILWLSLSSLRSILRSSLSLHDAWRIQQGIQSMNTRS